MSVELLPRLWSDMPEEEAAPTAVLVGAAVVGLLGALTLRTQALGRALQGSGDPCLPTSRALLPLSAPAA